MTLMKCRAALLAPIFAMWPLMVGAPSWAQTPAPGTAASEPAPVNSAMDAELMYQLLLGEMNVQGGDPGAGYSLILDAARKTNDARLYGRAVEIALRSRSGDAALQAARAWQSAQPDSRAASRSLLQVLLLLNRPGDTVEVLKREIALTPMPERPAAIVALIQIYGRVSDKKAAATAVQQGLADQLANRATAGAAWAIVGRLRLAAADKDGALEAAQKGLALSPRDSEPTLLALDLMDPKMPQAEALVKSYMANPNSPEFRMSYARALLDAQRDADAAQQLDIIIKEKPDFADAYLVQGILRTQANQLASAEASLLRYLELVAQRSGGGRQDNSRGLSQAYLSLAQLAEKKKDYAAAEQWLNRIPDTSEMLSAQTRRASILAKQGKLDQAVQLIRAQPARNPAEARAKITAEVSLLRENKRYQQAYDLLLQATSGEAKDADLVYDLAMMAEKLGRLDEMELRLRELIVTRPNFHHAYNALGYSLADRKQRLPEAKQLILKALEFAPGDPFITDSLAWVEFRMGNNAEALRLLDLAYKTRPDAEIAAHLGEVLWVMGQRERAQVIWREGLLLAADNDTLVETLQRFGVKP